jgi:death-on-curing protein
MTPRFLSLARLLEIHRDSIDVYGGDPGIRDIPLLQSGIAQPQATYGGELLHPDLPSMAAAYLYHVVMNHPFIDGNKRTGAMAGFIFLDMNGAELTASQEEYRDLTLGVAAGKLVKSDAVAFFKQHGRG